MVDIERGKTTAKLPFVMDPDARLAPNEHSALKVFRNQVKKLSSRPKDKMAVLESKR